MDRRKILLILATMMAALGLLIVWIWVQGAEGRAKEKFASVDVLVAAQDIAQGESFKDASGKFEKRKVPEDAVLGNALTSLDSLDGLVALTPMYEGEQILQSKWGGSADVDVTANVLAIPKGKVAMSVNLTEPARVSGFVSPGSEVAILVAVEDGRYSRTILRRVTVLGVGGTSTITTVTNKGDGESETEQIPQTLMTIAVTQKEAEKILWGATFGELSFALVNTTSELNASGPVNEPNLFQ